MRFGGVEIDTTHPPERKRLEEGNYEAEQKRIRNFRQIVPACYEHFFMLNGL
jgi:hypothetical protein